MNKLLIYALLLALVVFGGLGYQIGKAANPRPSCQSYQQGYTNGQIDYSKGLIKVALVQFAPNDVQWMDTSHWDTTGWNVQFVSTLDSIDADYYRIQ